MAKKFPVTPPTQIRYKGVFDWGGLYHLIRKWFDEHKYFYLETKYKDKTATPFGNEVEIKMEPYRKITEFVRYDIKIAIKIWDFKEFEAEINGQKKLVTDGRMVIWFDSTLVLDYNEKFKSDFQKKLLNLIFKLLKKYWEIKHMDNLANSTFDLHAQIKEYLNMETSFFGYKGRPG